MLPASSGSTRRNSWLSWSRMEQIENLKLPEFEGELSDFPTASCYLRPYGLAFVSTPSNCNMDVPINPILTYHLFRITRSESSQMINSLCLASCSAGTTSEWLCFFIIFPSTACLGSQNNVHSRIHDRLDKPQIHQLLCHLSSVCE